MEVKQKYAIRSDVILGSALLATLVLAYLPVLKGLVSVWKSSDDYSHGFLILPISLFILWQKKRALKKLPISPSWAGLVIAIVSLGLYVVARFAGIATLTSLSLIPVLSGMVIFLFGFRIFRECLFPIALLLFMIPVPGQIYAALTIPLQLFVTKVTAFLASPLGIPIYCEGNVIHLPNQTLQVVQACSGLRSIMTLLTLGAVFGYMTLKSNFLRGLLFCSGVPIAIAVNILRVLLMVVAFYYFQIDLAKGTTHTVFGVIIFAAAVVLFLVTRRILALWDR